MQYIKYKLLGYLRLMRPANILTAVADILAGVAIAGFAVHPLWGNIDAILQITCICLAAFGLYGGGVVFNDVFDADLDSVERPERPIPSGIVSKTQAIILGVYLLTIGVLAAFTISQLTGAIAIGIAAAALIYNKWGKHHSVLGPLNMGLCRGLNLLMGISIVNDAVETMGWLAFLPILYISAITLISRDEVHGGNVGPLRIAAVCYMIVYAMILGVTYHFHPERIWFVIPIVLLFIFLTNKPLLKAMKAPTGPNIGASVKGGIIAMIVMDAAWAAGFANTPYAISVIILLPISMYIGKLFAVT
ncbi:4-hydroxybenzoate polyprenyltransferase [Chitinophaga skermanii]|uniref:4-hydroxybenzoate polyprenyltransferase n=1 Tax=Chitinophaga skermanii TaxID=331697 RepID=A0A327R3X9_9BACT|nr:UbiA-like protein EboC [Chitinophaga skermanii]RAJ10758.1 4-hydroxybenzoate polyprenyltransferase [Chitinophaga skermanii]